MANQDSAIDRVEIATDLEPARIEFHRLLAEAEREVSRQSCDENKAPLQSWASQPTTGR
jgi:hypothetical protein